MLPDCVRCLHVATAAVPKCLILAGRVGQKLSLITDSVAIDL